MNKHFGKDFGSERANIDNILNRNSRILSDSLHVDECRLAGLYGDVLQKTKPRCWPADHQNHRASESLIIGTMSSLKLTPARPL